MEFLADISTVLDSTAITYTSHPILLSIPSSLDDYWCWQSKHKQKLWMSVRKRVSGQIHAQASSLHERVLPALHHLPTGSHQPHINSCIWQIEPQWEWGHSDPLHLTAEMVERRDSTPGAPHHGLNKVETERGRTIHIRSTRWVLLPNCVSFTQQQRKFGEHLKNSFRKLFSLNVFLLLYNQHP